MTTPTDTTDYSAALSALHEQLQRANADAATERARADAAEAQVAGLQAALVGVASELTLSSLIPSSASLRIFERCKLWDILTPIIAEREAVEARRGAEAGGK